jgi:hypothetical protein
MAAQAKAHRLFDAKIVRRAVVDSFVKLDPREQVRNPVMCTVYVGSILTTGLFVQSLLCTGEAPPWFILAISVWLWFTVLFANFAEAMAEARGKAQADALRRARHQVPAKKFIYPPVEPLHEPLFQMMFQRGEVSVVPAPDLRRGDVAFVEAGDYIPADGGRGTLLVPSRVGSAAKAAAVYSGETAPGQRAARPVTEPTGQDSRESRPEVRSGRGGDEPAGGVVLPQPTLPYSRGVPAVGLCSNTVTKEQTAKLARLAESHAGGVVTLMLDCDPEGESGARQAAVEIAQLCPVRFAWLPSMHGGAFKGRQPESLTGDEWEQIRMFLAGPGTDGSDLRT